jgi:hypothetical protein
MAMVFQALSPCQPAHQLGVSGGIRFCRRERVLATSREVVYEMTTSRSVSI